LYCGYDGINCVWFTNNNNGQYGDDIDGSSTKFGRKKYADNYFAYC